MTINSVLDNGSIGSAVSATSFNYDPATKTLSFTLPKNLADGNYRATISAGSLNDTAGNSLSQSFSQDFFSLAGDTNHDRTVDNADFTALFNHFTLPGTFADGDFNYDGLIDNADFTILFNNFTKHLDPPKVIAPAVATISTPKIPARGTRSMVASVRSRA